MVYGGGFFIVVSSEDADTLVGTAGDYFPFDGEYRSQKLRFGLQSMIFFTSILQYLLARGVIRDVHMPFGMHNAGWGMNIVHQCASMFFLAGNWRPNLTGLKTGLLTHHFQNATVCNEAFLRLRLLFQWYIHALAKLPSKCNNYPAHHQVSSTPLPFLTLLPTS